MPTVRSLSLALVAIALSAQACQGDEPATPAATAQADTGADGVVTVLVNQYGYEPATVQAVGGKPLKLIFKRTTAKGCGGELVFPDHGIKKQLPVDEEVVVELTPKQDEQIAFTCGMGMYEGKIVASSTGS